MTKPTIKQFFENFRGLDLTSSPLGRGIEFARSFKNIERLHNGSLRSREGLELCSQNLPVITIFPYIYVDSDEVTREELIGVAAFSKNTDNTTQDRFMALVKLTTANLNITYSGGDDFRYSVTKSSSGITFTLYEDSVSVLSEDLGTGYSSSDMTLQELADSISAVSNFSATVDNTAVVNGAQAGVTAITVDSGHTLSIGDMTYFIDSQTNNPDNRITEIINTSATTITIRNDGSYSNVDVADDLVIGFGQHQAAILQYTDTPGTNYSASTITAPFTCWSPIATQLDGDFLNTLPNEDESDDAELFYGLPDFSNQRNNLYFLASYFPEVSLETYIDEIGEVNYNAGLWKYDGKDYYLSGMFFELGGGSLTFTNTGSGSSPSAGDYKYSISFKRTDYQGNEIEFFHVNESEHTVSSGNNVHLQVQDTFADTYQKELNFKHAKLTSSATATATLNITSGHLFRVGDYIYVEDSGFLSSSPPKSTARHKVTAITATSITIDGAITASNNSVVSNFLLRIWRTKVASNTFYLCQEYPYYASTSQNYTDNLADDDLGILQTAVKPINIQYPFPRGKCVETHQGLVCVASGNTIHWEDADSIESSPRAISNTTLPYGTTGDIRSLTSNIDSSLFVVKPTAQFQILGNISSNEIEINKISENGIGVNGCKAISIINKALLGAGNTGVWSTRLEDVNKSFASQILKIFKITTIYDETGGDFYKLNLNKLLITYDKQKNWIHFYIPLESVYSSANIQNGYFAPGPTSGFSRHFVLMLSDVPNQPDCWAEFTYDLKQQGNGGFANIERDFYQQSCVTIQSSSGLQGFLHKRSNLSDAEAFLDNTSTYDSELVTAWDDAGEPSFYKFFLDFILYQLQPDFYVAPFTMEFESYRDWDDTKKDTERATTLSFSSSSDKEKSLQFDKDYKARRRSFKLSCTVNKTPMLISGYEYTVKENTYKKERLIK